MKTVEALHSLATTCVSVANLRLIRLTEIILSALCRQLIGWIADLTLLWLVTCNILSACGMLMPNFSACASAFNLICLLSLTKLRHAGASVSSYTVSSCGVNRCWAASTCSPSCTSDGSIKSNKASSESASRYSFHL